MFRSIKFWIKKKSDFAKFAFIVHSSFVKQFQGHISVVLYLGQYQTCIETLNPISVLLIPICFSDQYQQWLPCHQAEAGIASTETTTEVIFRLEYIDSYRAGSRFVPSQWETALLCKDVSHWLGASLELLLFVWILYQGIDAKVPYHEYSGFIVLIFMSNLSYVGPEWSRDDKLVKTLPNSWYFAVLGHLEAYCCFCKFGIFSSWMWIGQPVPYQCKRM